MASKKKGIFKEKLDWDDMTYGEASHHIGKKTTEKVHKSKKDYKRKPKHKRDSYDNWHSDGDL